MWRVLILGSFLSLPSYRLKQVISIFYRFTLHFDVCKVHTPTNALFIKLDKVLKFTLRITLTSSYMFRSTTTMREPSSEPS